jgi:hypothetical protein
MDALPGALLARLRERTASPSRNVAEHGTHIGTYADWTEAAAAMEGVAPGSGAATAFGAEHARAAGWPMLPMHVFRMPDGTARGSTDLPPDTAPPPADPSQWAAVEALTGRTVPGDLRDLYAVADGGFGPGIAEGLSPLATVLASYEDLRRRGPGYTGEAEWPATYLPISDTTGPVSYDLATGRVIAFDDYWYDDDVSIEDAFTEVAPDLATWLEAWLAR